GARSRVRPTGPRPVPERPVWPTAQALRGAGQRSAGSSARYRRPHPALMGRGKPPMIRPLRRRLPKPHAAFAELLTAEEAQEYLPLSRTSEALVYFAVHGYGWDRGQGWPARRQRRRRPVAIV